MIGEYFIIVGDHPHAGKMAKCVAIERIHTLGIMATHMRSADGSEFFVTDPKNLAKGRRDPPHRPKKKPRICKLTIVDDF